ncbi:conserved hypothetical protein [Actinacidiphila cocklensis]|uniref:Uncharacterized protein n=1 Tax=Actinacidiphila cocklensis TaxID=887465 RepID=A0A9W4E2Y5_9ACTN|nr:conserved hypothetical protein [Actinacidiphila cocklensis]
MARRPPGAIRAQRWPARKKDVPPARQVSGVPHRTRAAINQLEARHLWRGAVAEALHHYERFLRQPGRYLSLPWDDCPCCNPAEARDILGEALRLLPPAARAGLQKIVTPLDAEYLRRTLPDPVAASISPWHAEAWWRQRVRER